MNMKHFTQESSKSIHFSLDSTRISSMEGPIRNLVSGVAERPVVETGSRSRSIVRDVGSAIHTFPLFSVLSQKVNQTVDRPDELWVMENKLKLADECKQLDEEGYRMLYALIRYYQLECDHGTLHVLPYQMRKLKLGYRMDMDHLPPFLLHLVKVFIEHHRQKIEEENSRNALIRSTNM